MKSRSFIRRGLVLTAGALSALAVLIAALSAALDAGYFRGPFIRLVAGQTGRKIQINGVLETHFISLNPRVTAEGVTLGNPPWLPPGVTAEFEKIVLIFQIPGVGHGFGIQRLELDAANLHLMRDSTGRANWQQTDPAKGPQADPPLIRNLSMSRAHVDLKDDLRHLHFNGTVSADGLTGAQPLRIAGAGELNGRPTTFEITGDPLATASRKSPYGFGFSERSSGSHLTGSGSLTRSFNFDAIDAAFEAWGEDLEDLYFLTGVKLVNTGAYRLSGKVARRGTHTVFSDLTVNFGESDVQASVVIDSASGRPKFDAEFRSKTLRTTDLGARAAGREHDPDSGKLLLSDASLSPSAVRGGDWVVRVHARRVDVGRVSLRDVSAKMTIEQGILAVAPLLADVLGGKLTAHLTLDAKTDNPSADADLRFTGVQLGQFDYKDAGPPPAEGVLQARVGITGRGRSIHQVAASANGRVTAVVTRGAIRASLAELTGIDLRALGLMLTKNKQETGVRCIVAGFQARDGTLDAQTLVVDTEPVLITGKGQLHLDTESLDFALRGHPKSLRLVRLRAPVLIRGTLVHPAIGVQPHNAIAQGAEAAALGVVLTPLAGVLAFVDPGLAKDADCTSLQEQATASTR